MYNFRYHLITIISIFAALALGLLLGVAITGSDLVRDASSNLAESLTDQFNELNATNRALNDQLQAEQLFSEGLLVGWQKERLKGRTIIILTRTPEADDPLAKELAALITQCGGTPVTVRIDPLRGFSLEDESVAAELKQLLPEVENESYEITLAQALVNEWSFAVQGDESSVPTLFETNYPLTTLLTERQRLTVTVSYQSLLESLGTSEVSVDETADSPTLDTEGAPEILALAQQRSAFELAERLRLPYGVNGIIDTAVFTPSGEQRVAADSTALQIALAFDRKGAVGGLSYRHLGARVGAVALPDATQESSDANYYALLVQQGDYAETMQALSRETDLPCEIAPLEPMGRYGTVALLSGAERGIYGPGHEGVTPFPPAPDN
jgi:hypothetical protein